MFSLRHHNCRPLVKRALNRVLLLLDLERQFLLLNWLRIVEVDGNELDLLLRLSLHVALLLQYFDESEAGHGGRKYEVLGGILDQHRFFLNRVFH